MRDQRNDCNNREEAVCVVWFVVNRKLFSADPAIVIEMPATVFDCIKALSMSNDPAPMNGPQGDLSEDRIKISCDLETAHQLLAILVKACPAAVPFIANAIAAAKM